MNTKTPIILALSAMMLILGVALTASAEAPSDELVEAPSAVDRESPEQQIRVLLSAYHEFPSREDLLAVTPDAATILIAIYNDEDSRPTMRRRAIDALGFLKDDVSRDFLLYLLQNEGEVDTGYVHHAITAYSRQQGEGAIEQIERFIGHEDVQIRLTAVTAVRDFAGKAGLNLLQVRLESEQNELVRSKIQKSL